MAETTSTTNVSKFSSRIAASGLASPNKFEVEFTKIPKEAGGAAEKTQLNLMCDQVSPITCIITKFIQKQ
jgi:hypothetical protein